MVLQVWVCGCYMSGITLKLAHFFAWEIPLTAINKTGMHALSIIHLRLLSRAQMGMLRFILSCFSAPIFLSNWVALYLSLPLFMESCTRTYDVRKNFGFFEPPHTNPRRGTLVTVTLTQPISTLVWFRGTPSQYGHHMYMPPISSAGSHLYRHSCLRKGVQFQWARKIMTKSSYFSLKCGIFFISLYCAKIELCSNQIWNGIKQSVCMVWPCLRRCCLPLSQKKSKFRKHVTTHDFQFSTARSRSLVGVYILPLATTFYGSIWTLLSLRRLPRKSRDVAIVCSRTVPTAYGG